MVQKYEFVKIEYELVKMGYELVGSELEKVRFYLFPSGRYMMNNIASVRRVSHILFG